MINYRDLVTALRGLHVPRGTPVIAHASLSAFGEVHGGVDALLGAMCNVFPSLIMPAFTYKTMLTPQSGPPENGLDYGQERDRNAMAEFFRPSLPVDRLMGIVPEALRCTPGSQRSQHPILSFAGLNSQPFLEAQTLQAPLGPIRALTEAGGWVLLLGVDHTVNTSIHWGEALAGRKQFVRWALTPRGVVECPGFPGCSDGFQQIMPRLQGIARRLPAGKAWVEAAPLQRLVELVQQAIREDPLALLCDRSYCLRCEEVRKSKI